MGPFSRLEKRLVVCRCAWRRHKYSPAANAYCKPFQGPYCSREAWGNKNCLSLSGRRNFPGPAGKGSKAPSSSKSTLQTGASQNYVRTVPAPENREVATLPFELLLHVEEFLRFFLLHAVQR